MKQALAIIAAQPIMPASAEEGVDIKKTRFSMAKKYSKRRSPMIERLINNNDLGKLLLRLSVGGLMLFHGFYKLQHGYGFVSGLLVKRGLPGYISYGTLAGELLAPLLIVLGIYTRPAALVEAFSMAMAIYLVHTGQLFSLDQHGGYALELQALYLFGSIAIFFFGAGRYSFSRGSGLWN
jgi:putative oxidoreductase